MKVLIIAPYFFEPHRWMISAYKTALNLSRTMDVVVLTTGKPSFEQPSPRLTIYRMWDIFLPDPVNYSIVPGLIPHLERVIVREQPDVFLVNKHMFFTSLATFWLRLRGKQVIVATDTFPGIDWFPRNRLVKLVMALYARILGTPCLQSASQVVLYHRGLEPRARQLGLRYQVIHNGVDLEQVQRAIPASDIPREKLVVTYVGRLESVKGYDVLLQAAKQLTAQRYDLQFFLVGNTVGKEAVVRQYQSDAIRFLGHRNDIPAILKATDVFVLPSFSEGLPNALMEAMTAGCACIASNVGGVPVLIDHRQTGLLVKPGDPTALADQIRTLAADPALRQQLGEAARMKIREEFSWESIAHQYQELFTTLTS